MPRAKEICSRSTDELISMQIYSPGYFSGFSPADSFVKWAAVEVTGFDNVPQEMESFICRKGYMQFLAMRDQPATAQFFSIFLERGSRVQIIYRTTDRILSYWVRNINIEMPNQKKISLFLLDRSSKICFASFL